MTLYDFLHNQSPIEQITLRTNCPEDDFPGEDMLMGFISWDGESIHSLDGDTYSLKEKIYRYEWDETYGYTVWIKSNWIHGTLKTN